MNTYVKEELKRAFISKVAFGTMILSIALVFVGMFEYLSWISYGGISVLYIFLSGYNTGTANFLVIVFPILATLPFASSYVEDCKSGLIKYTYLRMQKRTYMYIRLVVNGIIGGTVLFIGPFVAFVFLMIAKTFTGMPMVKEHMETVAYFESIGVHSPLLMIIIILMTLFCCGFIIATIALGISTFIQNSYLTILIPFILYILSGTVLKSIYTNLNLLALYDVDYFGMSFTERILYGMILCIIGISCFFIGGFKNEEKAI
ncbi:hypothetical protein [Alkalicoccobacillus porphyridii]|uniref:Uncharacterized protein n=1 Tax=Alkalicoccobacillus porphyridii TaxID=2597270 RepID=A0A553ZWP3_9BACI|nr:hypothetical protein [Alkalicoccobacillus porphyridii]TSB45877.1 hypothetical protein FN960_13245 [Alkalicoccobacillus porphyridii]